MTLNKPIQRSSTVLSLHELVEKLHILPRSKTLLKPFRLIGVSD
jgi:hypothetical protein